MQCPNCTNSDKSLLEVVKESATTLIYLCAVCSKYFMITKEKK